MNLDLKLPSCPICKGRLLTYDFSSVNKGPNPLLEGLQFSCDAKYVREAKADFNKPMETYDPWSGWKCVSQCNKATEIALELLSKQTDD